MCKWRVHIIALHNISVSTDSTDMGTVMKKEVELVQRFAKTRKTVAEQYLEAVHTRRNIHFLGIFIRPSVVRQKIFRKENQIDKACQSDKDTHLSEFKHGHTIHTILQ